MDESTAEASHDAAAWFEQGEALFKQEYYAEALAAYERAIEFDPLDARFFAGKGAALGNLGRLLPCKLPPALKVSSGHQPTFHMSI